MKAEEQLQYSTRVFTVPALLVFLIWLVYWFEIKFGFNFNKLGLYPRTLNGFAGIITSPFIHSDTDHLFGNSVPLFILSASLFYFYREVSLKVLLYGGFFTGLLTWMIARPSYHIGASGIVYLLFSFIFFSGLLKKHYRLVAMSLITIFLYGSMIWYVLPIKERMSWEGHLSGFVVGIVLAFVYRKQGIVKEEFEFTKTEFDEYFDENGNYNPPPIEQELPEDFNITLSDAENELPQINYKYYYKEEE